MNDAISFLRDSVAIRKRSLPPRSLELYRAQSIDRIQGDIRAQVEVSLKSKTTMQASGQETLHENALCNEL